MQLMFFKPGPLAVDLATLNRSTQNKHGVGMAVVRAAIAVFAGRPPEFRHREHRDVGHAVAHVLMKRGK